MMRKLTILRPVEDLNRLSGDLLGRMHGPAAKLLWLAADLDDIVAKTPKSGNRANLEEVSRLLGEGLAKIDEALKISGGGGIEEDA